MKIVPYNIESGIGEQIVDESGIFQGRFNQLRLGLHDTTIRLDSVGLPDSRTREQCWNVQLDFLAIRQADDRFVRSEPKR